ncbi:MAG: lipid-binding SYLF domain-containing protein [Roseivirga sp.]|jgi:lipid-binding SYLF domain-containing protein
MKNQNSKTTKLLKLKNMRKSIINIAAIIVLTLTSQLSIAQTSESSTKLAQESKDVLAEMIKKAPSLESYYNQSYGYAVFPKVTKGAISVGVAAGKGVVYKNHKIVSASKLKQLTVGFQFGGQQYSEIIFFQNEEAFEQFMNMKMKFDGQVSAVALRAGASADISYSYGAAVFTQAIGGLMFEASIGGQHFTNKPISN